MHENETTKLLKDIKEIIENGIYNEDHEKRIKDLERECHKKQVSTLTTVSLTINGLIFILFAIALMS